MAERCSYGSVLLIVREGGPWFNTAPDAQLEIVLVASPLTVFLLLQGLIGAPSLLCGASSEHRRAAEELLPAAVAAVPFSTCMEDAIQVLFGILGYGQREIPLCWGP